MTTQGRLMLANAFGSFDPSGRTFTIHDSRTPSPWTNVVCNGRYGFVVSQNGGGFSWLDNSQLNVLTRWDMDLIRDDRGRFLYLADLEDDEVWSLAPAPYFPKYDSYKCAHTQGQTTFTTEHRGIRAVWTMGVAPSDPVEVWRVELTNTSGRERRLRISSFFEWCCGVAPDTKREFHRLFFTTRHDAARKTIFATKNMWDVPARTEKEHWNRPWPYVAAHAVVGAGFERDLATADKAMFLGRYSPQSSPDAMTEAAPLSGGFGRFVDASAALGGDLRLKPGDTVRIYYLLTIGETEKEVTALVDQYRDPSRAEQAISGSVQLWSDLLERTVVETEQPDLDLLTNYWLPYQAISGRLWGRTGYYQQSGAFGFRDQLQDSQVWLPIDPDRCRQQIMLHAAHQFKDGSVYHWWHPLAEFGLRTACSDDYLWLPFLTANYIRETGDWAILKATAPFVDDSNPTTLIEHCRRSMAKSFGRFSDRGLPHIGSCDWNDGLSAVGVEEKGESVWLGWFLVGILGDWNHILREQGDAAGADDLRTRREALMTSLNTHAWNGEYYRGATLDSGEWIGDKGCGSGEVFLNCQTWAILTEGAPKDRLTSAWKTVTSRLLADMGPLLLDPAYSVPDERIGYITRYSPGSRENGGVYMHAATWALAAACKQRDVTAVQRIWTSISPPTRGLNAEAYVAEPYVTPGNVDGPLSDTPGKAGWTWYTGSAAWLSRICLEWIMGIRPVWGGLLIDPCPFPTLGQVSVSRVWRGRRINVRFDARQFSAAVAPKMTVCGKDFAGNLLRLTDLPADGDVEVVVSWDSTGPGVSNASVLSKEMR